MSKLQKIGIATGITLATFLSLATHEGAAAASKSVQARADAACADAMRKNTVQALQEVRWRYMFVKTACSTVALNTRRSNDGFEGNGVSRQGNAQITERAPSPSPTPTNNETPTPTESTSGGGNPGNDKDVGNAGEKDDDGVRGNSQHTDNGSSTPAESSSGGGNPDNGSSSSTESTSGGGNPGNDKDVGNAGDKDDDGVRGNSGDGGNGGNGGNHGGGNKK